MYDKSILAKSTGASLGVVAIVGLLFVSTGTAFAMPVAGIGGFTIQADTIEGEGMILYPGTSDAENSTDVANVPGSNTGPQADQYPVGVVELDSTYIEGMQLMKVFDLENNTANLMPGKARIVIAASGNVTSGTLMMKTPQLSAEQAEFSGMTIDENTVDTADDVTSWLELRTNQDPKGPLEGPASQFGSPKKTYEGNTSDTGMVMQQPYIRATYLATDQITIPGMQLEVQYDNDNDGDYEWAS